MALKRIGVELVGVDTRCRLFRVDLVRMSRHSTVSLCRATQQPARWPVGNGRCRYRIVRGEFDTRAQSE